MKKFLKGFLTCALLTLMIAPALPVSAAVNVNSTNFRPVFDFDKVPTEYTVSSQPGSATDVYNGSKRKKFINALNLGMTYNLSIVNGQGVSGNALKLEVSPLAPEGGSYDPITFNLQYGQNKVMDVSGATDFMFWADTTKFNNLEKGIQLVMYEYDCDKAGEITEEQTGWLIKNKADGGFFYVEDGKGGWAKKDAGTGRDFYIPQNYKGWVRIPLANCTYPMGWGETDVNNKFDGKKLFRLDFSTGNYANQIGGVLIFDQIGFYGNFKAAPASTKPSSSNTTGGTSTKPSTTKDSNTASTSTKTSPDKPAAANDKTASDAPAATPDSTTNSASENTNTAADETNTTTDTSKETSTEPDTSAASADDTQSSSANDETASSGDASSDVSTAAATEDKDSNNVLPIIIIAGVVIVCGVGGFFAYKKIKK